MGNLCGCAVIDESTVGVVERFGKYNRLVHPGFNTFNGISEKIVKRPSLKLHAFHLEIETITKEQVSIKIKVGVQYKINFDNFCENREIRQEKYDAVYLAMYLTDSVTGLLQQFINSYFRSVSRDYTMEQLFSSKNKLSDELMDLLNREIYKYGYLICKTLITDIDPPETVKKSMNLVLESQNKRDAMVTQSQAEKEMMILKAEGLAKTRQLEGQGLALQRLALAEGLKDSMYNLCGKDAHLNPEELTKTILQMQYIDMLNQAAHTGKNTFIMQCHPNALNDVENQVRNAILSTNKV